MTNSARKPGTDARLRHTGACLLLVIGTSFLATAADAGDGVWTSGGPDGYISVLAVDPKTPSTLYAGGYDKVFRSTDSGGTWAITGISVFAWDYGVGAIAIDPSTPSTLYVGGEYGVSKSTDAGATPASTEMGPQQVTALAINPSNPSTLYAGTYGSGVFKSTDSGGTWAAANAGLPNQEVHALAVNPAGPATLYAGTLRGVFKSTNSGGNWTAANAGLTSLMVYSLAIDPVTSSTLYAGTYGGGVFKSTDSGGTWAPANTGLTNVGVVNALAVDPTTPSTLYAGTDGGVFRSTDGGGTWNAINAGLPDLTINALALDPSGGTTLYAGTGSGVWQLTAPTGGITANFSFTPAPPIAGQPVQFTDTSSGGPSSWSWDFGDGYGSTAQNPIHAFATAGAFPVTLTASNTGGSSSTTKTVTVSSAGASTCVEDASTLCLVGGRYRVQSHWRNQYAGGAFSNLSKQRLTDLTGAFWAFDQNTYEYLIRFSTATDNGRIWIAIATFTDVEFWIDVTDTFSGQSRQYHSPHGNKTLIYDPYFFVFP